MKIYKTTIDPDGVNFEYVAISAGVSRKTRGSFGWKDPEMLLSWRRADTRLLQWDGQYEELSDIRLWRDTLMVVGVRLAT